MASVCLNHPDTPAETRCASCGKPICARCIVFQNGSKFCSSICADSAQLAAGRLQNMNQGKQKSDRKKGVRFLIVLFLLIAAAAAGYLYYTENQEEVHSLAEQADSLVEKAGKDIKKGVKNTKENLKDGIPTSSSYKRNRENLVE